MGRREMAAYDDHDFMAARRLIAAYRNLLADSADIPSYTTLGIDYDVDDDVAIPDHLQRGAIAYAARRALMSAEDHLDRWLDHAGSADDLPAIRIALGEGLRRLSQLGAADDGIYNYRYLERTGEIDGWLDEHIRDAGGRPEAFARPVD